MTTLDMTTADELSALPVGSLIYDKYGDYWEKRPEGWTLYALLYAWTMPRTPSFTRHQVT